MPTTKPHPTIERVFINWNEPGPAGFTERELLCLYLEWRPKLLQDGFRATRCREGAQLILDHMYSVALNYLQAGLFDPQIESPAETLQAIHARCTRAHLNEESWRHARHAA